MRGGIFSVNEGMASELESAVISDILPVFQSAMVDGLSDIVRCMYVYGGLGGRCRSCVARRNFQRLPAAAEPMIDPPITTPISSNGVLFHALFNISTYTLACISCLKPLFVGVMCSVA